MSQFEYHKAGNTQAQQDEALAYLLAQVSAGKAVTGVLSGLGVSQTATASGSVLVGAGAGVAQAATLDGAGLLVNDSQATLDVFTANPMSSLPRNDIVVFDRATTSVRAIIGTPSATPSDPTVPTSAIPLARLRNAASATTIPSSAIDDLRSFTRLAGVRPASTFVSRTTSYDVGPGITSPALLSCPMPAVDSSTRCRVTCYVPGFNSTVAADRMEVLLYDGSGAQCGAGYVNVAAGVGAASVFVGQITAPAPAGTVTMKAKSLGTGTITIRGVEGWYLEVVPV